MSSTRDRLRDATRAVHERMHDHASFQDLLARDISKANYGVLLSGLLGYQLALEADLNTWSADPDLKALFIRRSGSLAADLAHIGQSEIGCHALPIMPTGNFIVSDASFLGCLYVREGALIGGRSLARNLDHLLGNGRSGRTFFLGEPRDTQVWKELCAALNLIEDTHEQDQAIAAALVTFGLFERWMGGMEPISHSSVQLQCPIPSFQITCKANKWI